MFIQTCRFYNAQNLVERKITSLFCLFFFALLLLATLSTESQAKPLDVRVWPAEEYTRITIENDKALKASQFLLNNPPRLVVDIEGLTVNPQLKKLVSKIRPDDPYVQKVRVGQHKTNIARLVFDLKEEIKPQVFSLKPHGKYRHRLVLDLFPTKAKSSGDSLTELIKNQSNTSSTSYTTSTQDEAMPEFASTSTRTAATTPSSSSIKLPANRHFVVVLDPGHGGEDSGAVGPRGTREKDIVLSIARKLKAKIERHPQMRVVMTRNADFFVPLNTRVEKARKAQGDLFISIHADAFIKPSARGSSVFALSEKGASSTAAKWLAKSQNDADLIGGVNVKGHSRQVASVIMDLSTTAQIKDSLRFGRDVLSAIGKINTLHSSRVEQAGFVVLKAPDIPSILVETAFVSNPKEELKLRTSSFQDQIAEAILTGIKKYFARNPGTARNKKR